MFLKKIVKKNSWLLVSNLIISLILSSTRRGIDARFFDFVPAFLLLFLLLPLVSGILLILIQNKNRSYEFLPNLLIGSCLNNAIIILVINSTEYFRHGYAYRQFIDIFAMIELFLPLVVISVFGGLIGLVIKGTSEQIKKYPDSKITLVFRKIFGGIFLSIGAIGSSVAIVIFLVLAFHPSSSWLKMVMVDFKLIEVVGVILYYLLLLSTLSIVLIPLIFVMILGLMLFFSKKKFFNKKLFSRLIIYFFIWLVIFLLLSSYTESKFELKKAKMKENKIEEHFDIKDFDNIYISRFVKFDEIKIIQGDKFDIVVKGSQYDRIGLDFKKKDDKTLVIKRSELETYYNTETWRMENDNIPFSAGTKHLTIEIIMPDISKIESEGGHIELVDFKVGNIEIKLNKRFNNIKGNIIVGDTLKLDTRGGIINFVGSAKNLIINSGDCWIEMDRFNVENATINAKNTSRLNVNVSNDIEIQLNENSGITNHYINKEPLSYSAHGINILKEYRPFSYTSEQLRGMSDECGIKYDVSYFDRLISKFSNSMEIIYSFKYQGGDQDSRSFVVTLLPNKAEYSSFEEFKKDFDLCAAGGDLYPAQLNRNWLLFVNSCGSGALSHGSDSHFSCDEVKKIVEPSLKLN